MRVALKFTIALTLLLFAGLFAYGFVSVERERELFEKDLARDGAMVSRSLTAAIERLWPLDGERGAMDLASHVNRTWRSVDVRWITASNLSPEALETFGSGKDFYDALERRGSMRRAAVHTPVRIDGEVVGAVAASRRTSSAERYLATSARRVVIASLAIATAAGILIMTLGAFIVGRPLARVVEVARRAGSGDLSARVQVLQSDEIGALARELNLSYERLAEARGRAEQEYRARLASEERLRHADRLTTVGTLSAAVAHELGTPLNVVLGRASMIASGEMEGELARKSGHIITEQVERMTKYIRQLLDFARVNDPVRAVHDLRELVSQTFELLQPYAHKRGARLLLHPSEGDARASFDRGQIQQTLSNLLVNAIQSMPSGGTVEVKLERKPIDGQMSLGVSIRDQGTGIPDEVRELLFSPFYTTKPAGEGTGIGLWVASDIIKAHDGRIDISTFTVWLPARA